MNGGCLAIPDGTQGSFDVATRHNGATTTVAASGELDIATAATLEAAVRMGAAGSAETVVLDLSRVTFLDSSGLHALMTLAEGLGERLRIVPSDTCRRFLAIAGVADRLPLI